MGSASSKFRKHLQNGEEFEALHLLQNNSELRKNLNVNNLCGEDSPMHLVCKYSMKGLLRGTELEDCSREKAEIGSQDKILISHDCPLFIENSDKLTPCDLAEKCGHNDIALYLESKMVFSSNQEEESPSTPIIETPEAYNGLRAQDLQEAKDQLLVETADMLNISLFAAEALLRNHSWSREQLLESWIENSVKCCYAAKIAPPSHLLEEDNAKPPLTDLTAMPQSPAKTPEEETQSDEMCEICVTDILQPFKLDCGHLFCNECWKRYLTLKIEDGEVENITCPGYDCNELVPSEVVESLVPRDVARRYLQFDIKILQNFVDTNPAIKWCPFPGCGRAVRLPVTGKNAFTATQLAIIAADHETSHSVDCGEGHHFCWQCLGEAHAPCSCDNWKKWHEKISQVKPQELQDTAARSEQAASCFWLVTNSKSCPNCEAPIQKNEGCNHMKCGKCKYDFCWVCLESWKKHSSATGGYFRCNRYEVVKKVEQDNATKMDKAALEHQELQELSKFVHYFTRYKNHENSFSMEEPLLDTAKEKMLALAKAVTTSDVTADVETRFVEDAIHRLLNARRILKYSYIYGYYLEETGYRRQVFDLMQTELEQCSEALSEMVCRPYLRTPKNRIISQAALVQQRNNEFIQAPIS